MSYIASDDIKVYPSARRAVTKPESRMLTEARFVNMINRLIDTDGFIVNDNFASSGNLEFNIYGYYFSADIGTLLSLMSGASVGQHLQAHIQLATTGDITELVGVDSGSPSTYSGVDFTIVDTITTSTSTDKYLGLLTKTAASAYELCTQGKYKFNGESLNQPFTIDGGVI